MVTSQIAVRLGMEHAFATSGDEAEVRRLLHELFAHRSTHVRADDDDTVRAVLDAHARRSPEELVIVVGHPTLAEIGLLTIAAAAALPSGNDLVDFLFPTDVSVTPRAAREPSANLGDGVTVPLVWARDDAAIAGRRWIFTGTDGVVVASFRPVALRALAGFDQVTSRVLATLDVEGHSPDDGSGTAALLDAFAGPGDSWR